MRSFVIDKSDDQYIKQNSKGTQQYIMPDELVDLYDNLNKTGQIERIQLLIDENAYEFDLQANSVSLISKKFPPNKKLVLIFPPCCEIGVIRLYQSKTTFAISKNQKVYPHGDANEIQINIPKELDKLYQNLSQKGRGSIPIRLEIDDLSIDLVLHPHLYFYHKILELDEVDIHIMLQFQESRQNCDSGILIRKFSKTKETAKKKKQKNHRTYEEYQKEYDLLNYMFGFSQVYIQESENKALKECQKDMNDLYQKYVSRLQKKCLKNTGRELSRK